MQKFFKMRKIQNITNLVLFLKIKKSTPHLNCTPEGYCTLVACAHLRSHEETVLCSLGYMERQNALVIHVYFFLLLNKQIG